MKVLIGTYGKTWHTWQVDRGDKLPLGIPQLMMAFTKDGQLDPKIAAERDKLYPVSVAAKKAARADIPDAKIDPGADAWQNGSRERTWPSYCGRIYCKSYTSTSATPMVLLVPRTMAV